jgi:integrase
MSVERIRRQSGTVRYRVRWREHGRNRAETFDRRRDAELFEADVRRRKQLGTLADLDAGTETLDHYVTHTWTPVHAVALAQRTRDVYAIAYDSHVSPYLGRVPLREITPERVAEWQARRLSAGIGPHAVRKAGVVLSSVMQRAAEAQRIPFNPVRVARTAKVPASRAVRPLAPATVEQMRGELGQRDGTLVSVLAYGGLRPGEALDLRWADVLDRTLIVSASKTGRRRTVRLFGPLVADLAAWRLASGRPPARALVFPSAAGGRWTDEAYKSWARHAFARAAKAAGVADATPYTLRHSFVSLLLAEGASVLDVASQAGNKASLVLDTYGHLFADFDHRERVSAEAAIRGAREGAVPVEYPQPIALAS